MNTDIETEEWQDEVPGAGVSAQFQEALRRYEEEAMDDYDVDPERLRD